MIDHLYKYYEQEEQYLKYQQELEQQEQLDEINRQEELEEINRQNWVDNKPVTSKRHRLVKARTSLQFDNDLQPFLINGTDLLPLSDEYIKLAKQMLVYIPILPTNERVYDLALYLSMYEIEDIEQDFDTYLELSKNYLVNQKLLDKNVQTTNYKKANKYINSGRGKAKPRGLLLNDNEQKFYNDIKQSNSFNKEQLKVIERGLGYQLPLEQIKLYADPEFNYLQMTQILNGFIKGLSMDEVTIYAKPEFSNNFMLTLQYGLLNGLSIEQVKFMANPKFSEHQIDQFLYAFQDGLSIEEVKIFAKPEILDIGVMDIAREALLNHSLTIEQIKFICNDIQRRGAYWISTNIIPDFNNGMSIEEVKEKYNL